MIEYEVKGDRFWRLRRAILLSKLAICSYLASIGFVVVGLLIDGKNWLIFAANLTCLLTGSGLTYAGIRMRRVKGFKA